MRHIRLSERWAAPAVLAAVLLVLPSPGVSKVSGKLWTERATSTPPPSATTPAWSEIALSAKPAVVNLTTDAGRERAVARGPEMPVPDELQREFRDFFRRFKGPSTVLPMQGRGSGFIIHKDGYILTNNHVIDGAKEVRVKLSDARSFTAKVVGQDAKTDIALLKIDGAGNLPVLPLGDSDALQSGEPVMAIGNPFGLEQTVTTGIVSATGRVIGGGPYDDFIQTDASINPGNSGGPLINAKGEAVGLNTAIFSRTGGSIGIGFAVPINMAKFVAPQLAAHGKVERGRLGVTIQPLSAELAKSFGLAQQDGALVSSVAEGSPAAQVGVRPGDVVVEYDGHKVGRPTDLSRAVAATPAGKQVTMKVMRDGKQMTLSPTIARLAEKEDEAVASAITEGDKRGRLGVAVEPLTPETARELGASEKQGLVVKSVQDGSPADQAGIRPGDVITEVNRQPVRSAEDLRQAVEQHKAGTSMLLLLKREGSARYLIVQV
jgi:serine protease Do